MIDARTAARLRERARPLGPAVRRAMEAAIRELGRLDWNGAAASGALPPAGAEPAARQVERALQRWPDALREAAAAGVADSGVQRALVDWLLGLPLPLPLRLDTLLRNDRWPARLPVGLGCWVLARGGPQRLTDWLLRPPALEPADERPRVEWFCRVAQAMTAPPPLSGKKPPRTHQRLLAEHRDAEVLPRSEARSEVQAEVQPAVRPLVRPIVRPETLRGFTRSRPPDAALMASVQEVPGFESAVAREQVQHQSAEPPAPASEAAAGEPAFHFLLQGAAARRDSVRANSQAELHFRLGDVPAEALATVHHAALDQAVQQDLDVALQLTPLGAVRIEGRRRRVVQLRGGKLQQPVWFQLATGEAPALTQPAQEQGAEQPPAHLAAAAEPPLPTLLHAPSHMPLHMPLHTPPLQQPAAEEHGVHVEFIVQGATVHQQMLAIRVLSAAQWDAESAVPAAAATEAAPVAAGLGLLARAAASAPPPADQVRLSLAVDGSGLRVELQHLKNGADWQSDSASSAAFDLAALASLGQQVRNALAGSYQTGAAAWAAFDGQVNPADTVQQKALRRALEATAAAGSLLNQALRSDADLARLLDYMEHQVPPGARLTVSTDQVFLPWELLTPQTWSLNLSEKQRSLLPPLDPGRFWGARFAVETVPRRVPVGRRMLDHLAAAPRRVNLNVNPDITLGNQPPAGQPMALHQAWAERLQNAGALDGDVHQSCEDMRAVLQDASQHASLVYLYCHGNSDAPFGGASEQLVMDEDCALAPPDLAGPADYANAPIVFLNACESGVASPLAFSQFLRSFCERGALGLIATTHKVPIRFAAHFGPQCVDAYLGWRGSLAEMLRTLRQQHLAQGNPVPLYYTVQCQLVLPP